MPVQPRVDTATTPPPNGAGSAPAGLPSADPVRRVPSTEREIREQERDLIDDILGFAEDRQSERHTLVIPRRDDAGNVRARLEITVRPLSAQQIEACREEATAMRYDPETRARRRMLDDDYFESKIILEATVPEDRARLWQNPKLIERFKIDPNRAHDAIDAVLKPGEKRRLFLRIQGYCGFAMAEDQELEEAVVK